MMRTDFLVWLGLPWLVVPSCWVTAVAVCVSSDACLVDPLSPLITHGPIMRTRIFVEVVILRLITNPAILRENRAHWALLRAISP